MRRMSRALSAGLAVALVATACGSNGDEPEETPDTGDEVTDDEVTDEDAEPAAGALGPYRLGWVLAYLSPEYALTDLYTTGAGSNYFGYANSEFDQALQDANAADPDEADAAYQAAEDILLADLPLIPMWYGLTTSVWTEKISNVVIDPATYLRVEFLESEDGEAVTNGCSVQDVNLRPADTREVCGGRLVNQIWSGLTVADPETGEPEMQVAESIDTEDSITWEVTLNDGWTFHDGSPVTADSFVDAWNFAANPDNGLRGQGFYSQISGFSEMGGDVTELEGLEVTDDLNLTITLNEPFSPFLTKLSDSAFFPMPESFFEDPDGFGDDVIGNGRFQVETLDVEGDTVLTRYEDWNGDEPASLDQVTYRFYQDVQTAYLDVQGGNLDVQDSIPPTELTTVDDTFGDRVSRTPSSSFTYLGFPMYQPEFGDNLELRQALSLAIDRQQIIDVIFDGAFEPATAVIPPVLEAHRPDACDVCEFDAERAQQLFEEAGGYDGTMTLYFNADAGHEDWVEAVANQWRDVLGIEDFEFESLDFAQYLDILADGAGVAEEEE